MLLEKVPDPCIQTGSTTSAQFGKGYAQGEKAEKLKQRIIQLQLQLEKLQAQKAKWPVQDEEQKLKKFGLKFKK